MAYSILKADIENNRIDIHSIINRNLGLHSEQWYAWKYHGCPDGLVRCWMLKDDNSGDFIGTAAIFPRRYSLDNKSYSAGIVGDFAIDKGYRSLGLALRLQKHILAVIKEEGFDFIYGIPNALAEAVLLKSGYSEIGTLSRYVKLLKTESKLKKYVKPLWVARILSVACDFFLKVVSNEQLCRMPEGYCIKVLDLFDQEVDALVRNTGNHKEINSIRSYAFLQWRYQAIPGRNYKVLFLYSSKKEIIGYAVFTEKENVYYIEDVFPWASEKTLNLLLSKVIDFSRQRRINSVSINFFGNTAIKKKLLKFGFRIREMGNKVFVYSDNSHLRSQLLNEENWFFVNGDSDA